jgi:hypothetical protein
MRNLFGGDPYYNNVILHLPFQEHTNDVSPQKCPITQNGTGIYSGAQYRPTELINARASYWYDPPTHYLLATVSALENGPWTIEFWARSPNVGNGTGMNTELRNADNDANGFALYFRSTGKYALGGGNPFTATESTLTWATNTWYHIAAVRRGDTIFVYINGKLQITRSWSTSITRTSWRIGAQWDGADISDGYLADLRVTKGVARYTTNFIPSYYLYPIQGIPSSLRPRVPISLSEIKRPPIFRSHNVVYGGNVIKNYPKDLLAAYYKNILIGQNTVETMKPVANSIVNTQFETINTIYNVSSSKNYINIPGNRTSRGATIIAEVNISNTTSPQYQRFCTVGNEGFVFRGQTGVLHTYGYVNGTFQQYTYSGYLTGRHIYAATYDGVYFKIYRDGALLGTSANFSGPLTNFNSIISINQTAGEYVAGNIIRVAVFDRALSLSEVNYWSYGVDFSSFINSYSNKLPIPLPSAAIRPTKISVRNDNTGDTYFNNVVLQLPFSSHMRDTSKYNRTIGINGNTSIINNAAYFDGNGDYLSYAESAELEIGGGDFTIEAWINLTGYSSGYNTYYKSSILTRDLLNNRAFSFNVSGTASSWTALEMTLFSDNTTGYTYHSAPYSFELNKWYHVAGVKSNSIVTLYVNGIPILQESDTRIIQNIGTSWLIGRTEFTGYEYYFPGYISNLRVTNSARYRGSFTSPKNLALHGIYRPNKFSKIITTNIIVPQPGKIYLTYAIDDKGHIELNKSHPLYGYIFGVSALPTQAYYNRTIKKGNVHPGQATGTPFAYVPGKGLYLDNTTARFFAYFSDRTFTGEFTQIIRFKPENPTVTTALACSGAYTSDATQIITNGYGDTVTRALLLDCGTNNTTIWMHYAGVFAPILRITQTINQECWYVYKTKSNTLYLSIYTLSGSLIASTSGAPCTGNSYSSSYAIGCTYHSGTGYANSFFTFTKLLSAEEESRFVRDPYSIITRKIK